MSPPGLRRSRARFPADPRSLGVLVDDAFVPRPESRGTRFPSPMTTGLNSSEQEGLRKRQRRGRQPAPGTRKGKSCVLLGTIELDGRHCTVSSAIRSSTADFAQRGRAAVMAGGARRRLPIVADRDLWKRLPNFRPPPPRHVPSGIDLGCPFAGTKALRAAFVSRVPTSSAPMLSDALSTGKKFGLGNSDL